MTQSAAARGVDFDEVDASPEIRSPVVRDGTTPTRTCVGCRSRDAKTLMVRIVVLNGEFIPDPAACLPGRGAYLHPAVRCLALALRRGALRRALRAGPQAPIDRLSEIGETWN